jgi:hypothetical protein
VLILINVLYECVLIFQLFNLSKARRQFDELSFLISKFIDISDNIWLIIIMYASGCKNIYKIY